MDSTKTTERIYFNQLKKKLRIRVETKLEIRKDFKEWSIADIHNFQIDLEQSCQSTVSEKWVYLHFKNQSEKMPRVDVLNLLSRYCGYKNWDDFKFKNQVKPTENKPKAKVKVAWLLLPVLVLLLAVFWWNSRANYTVMVFKDAYTHQLIDLKTLTFTAAKSRTVVKGGALQLKVNQLDTLQIDGAYYKPFSMALDKSKSDTVWVELWPDDYALMLNYFSRAQSDNWEKRRMQLEEAIHDDSKIFQSHPKHQGIEMLNKHEFIDRLILPVNSLKNLEIQDIQYQEGKIYRLRFVQKTEDYENE